MSEEIVDIVDTDCGVLYSAPKTEAHEKGLLHRTVICEVRDKAGNWVLIRQAGHKQDAGQYVSPVGGHVKAGETDEDALSREVLEEIGLTDFDHQYVGRFVFERKVIGRHENHYFIIYMIYTDEPFTLNDESVDYAAFSENELKQLLKEKPHQFGAAFFAVLDKFHPHMLRD
jgi:isopentenyl-diphosphate Delta-isomerase